MGTKQCRTGRLIKYRYWQKNRRRASIFSYTTARGPQIFLMYVEYFALSGLKLPMIVWRAFKFIGLYYTDINQSVGRLIQVLFQVFAW